MEVLSPSGRFSAKSADKEVSFNDISVAGYPMASEAIYSIANLKFLLLETGLSLLAMKILKKESLFLYIKNSKI